MHRQFHPLIINVINYNHLKYRNLALMYNSLERSFSSRPQGDKTFMEPAHHLLTHAVRKQAIGLSDEPF